jgi:pimeloyl-ACP methyl ester carboxylesterase
VAALLDGLGVHDAVVVGNCMGSAIACGLADARPDLVRGLVLVNPLTEGTFSAGWLAPLHRMAAIAPGSTDAVRRASRRVVLPKAAAVASVRFQLGPKGVAAGVHHDPELVAGARRRRQVPALVDVLDDLAAYGRLDRRDRGLDVPAVVVWGERNRVLSPRAGLALDDRLGVSERVVLAGCGHLPMLEDPDAVTAIVRRVIDETDHENDHEIADQDADRRAAAVLTPGDAA